jgi:hypothetical protein
MTDALQSPHPEVPFARVGYDTISALAALAAIFKLKLCQTQPPTLLAVPPTVTQRTCLAESSNPILDYPMPLPRQTRSQTTIHTQEVTNAPLPPRVVTPSKLNPSPLRVPFSLAETFSPQPVPKRLLRNGHCPHGHRPRKQQLVSAAPSKRHHPPRHRERNGINGTYEGPPFTTTLDTRIWQRMWTPIPRHSGHSWHQHMFLYQTHKHLNDRKITYSKIVCDFKPHKKEKERVRLTVGGDRLDYSGDVHRGRRHHDEPNYYLGTPLPRFEYMKMLLSHFPEEIVQKYKLNALAVDGWVYI